MKAAFSTLGCPGLGFEDVIALANRNGMAAVEIRLDGEDRVCGYDLDTVGEAKLLLNKSSVVISDLATGISFDGLADYGERVEHCARLAQAIGAPALRVFVHAEGKRPDNISKTEMERTAASLQESAEIAARYGISLWVETHSAYSTGKSVAALLSLVQRDNVRVIWDIMHSIEFGETPKESVEQLGNLIAHVHLKDGVREAGREHYRLTSLGEGDVVFEDVAKALELISYDGYLSLEWELMWHPELGACYPSSDALLRAYRALLDRAFA